eukprot:750129-Hanusia_phi.AAC.2
MAEVGMDVMPLPPLSLAGLGPGKIATVFRGERNCVVEFDGERRMEVPVGQYGEYHLCRYIRLRKRLYYIKCAPLRACSCLTGSVAILSQPQVQGDNSDATSEQQDRIARGGHCLPRHRYEGFQYKVQGKWKKERTAGGELIPVMAFGGNSVPTPSALPDLRLQARRHRRADALRGSAGDQERLASGKVVVFALTSAGSVQVLAERDFIEEALLRAKSELFTVGRRGLSARH